ncbi:MAG TPA: aminopeptidase [Phycisphaerales bacterium]|nr:aminopeptidase [Phycisphaerales bacterium]
MPRDQRIERLAEVLVNYSARVKPGDICGVVGDDGGRPLSEALARAIIRAGGQPFLLARPNSLHEAMLAHATDEQLARPNPMWQMYIETVNVHFAIWAEKNTKSLSRFDPKRTALLSQARKPFLKTFMERAGLPADDPRRLRWCGTLLPTEAHAQDAEMSLTQYEDFVFKAGLLHLEDPAAEWTRVFERQEKVRAFLQGKKQLRFRAPAEPGVHDGTDLRVDVSKGRWINCAGHENFPDGEVFAGPTLPGDGGFGVEGHVNYTFPAVYNGREVEGVRLAFKGGRVADASATKNEDFLFKMLDQDANARNLGEIAIGTNYSITEFSRNTLFDEKIGGTFHAAVGAGYPESGNTNESALHWDMVCDLRPRLARDGSQLPGGTIEADGEVFHRDGKFLMM